VILTGKTISPGLALDAARSIPPRGDGRSEVERLHAAIGRAGVELDRVQRQLTGRVESRDVLIFESHAGLMRDPKFVSRVEHEIRNNTLSAEAAVSLVTSELHAAFLANPVPLVHDKAADILDIGRRLIQCLSASLQADVEFPRGAVLVAPSLTPSQLVRFVHSGGIAVVTETCGTKSHTAILARGLGIPLVTGIPSVSELIPHGGEIVVDGSTGRVIVSASPEEQAAIGQMFAQQKAETADDEGVVPDPPVTSDGVRIRVLLNISDLVEAADIGHLGADGVGLFRTEFAYMDRDWWPTEDEIYASYRAIAAQLGERELNLRLVDFGAEKCPAYADIPLNRNPSLGLRGIRLLLQREDILKPQVRAIARLARERPVTLLVPMLDTPDTLESTIDALCRSAGCGLREQLPFRLGAMIEVPAAALLVEEILPRVDSISIGLNDLTQYLLAADRDDEFVEKYHDAMQPAVLRLLHQTVMAADSAGKPLTICGELAGDPRLTGLLLALGIRRLSVARSSYRRVIASVRRFSLRSMEGMGAEVLKQGSAAAVRKYVSERLS